MASGQTENYGLNQWAAEDAVLREEFNRDNAKLDMAIENAARWHKLIDLTLEKDTNPLSLDLRQHNLSSYHMLMLSVQFRTTLSTMLYVRINGDESNAYTNVRNSDSVRDGRTELLEFCGDQRNGLIQIWISGLTSPPEITGLSRHILGWGVGYGSSNIDMCRGIYSTLAPNITSVDFFSVGESNILTGSRFILYGIR